MGNSNGMKVISIQICCQKGICTPQYEITFQEYEYKYRVSPNPGIHQEILKSFVVDIDSQLSSLDTSRQLKLEQALNYAKILKLRVLSSSTLKLNAEFIINTLGYEKSLRTPKDGITYIGVKKRNKPKDLNGTVINDIIIPVNDKTLATKHRGQHFCIFYELNKNCYSIRDLSLGFGTFAKVNDILNLRDNFLLYMGEHYLLINLFPEFNSKLRIKLFGPPCEDKIFFLILKTLWTTGLKLEGLIIRILY
jgi:hypothetical protein